MTMNFGKRLAACSKGALMRDYLADIDDYAHLAADCPLCGDCRRYAEPVYGEKTGTCMRWGMKVSADYHNPDYCWEQMND